MKIRKSKIEELNIIMRIYAQARRFMAENGNYIQWGPTNWPPDALIVEDITAGKSYVCVDDDNKIHGVFYYDYGKNIDATYDVIEPLFCADVSERADIGRDTAEDSNIEHAQYSIGGAWLSDEPYGVVHRIATDRTPGVGSFCINWAFEKSGHLRMDTHDSNVPMNRLLNKLGFNFTGIIHVAEDDHPRNAYEKI